jgi:hypothetical protein
MFFPQNHHRFFFLKVANEIPPAHTEEIQAEQAIKRLLLLVGTQRDVLCLAEDVGHSCISSQLARLEEISYCVAMI